MNSPIVRQIVGRCHVGETNKWVIRYVIGKLKGGYKAYRKIPRSLRRELLEQIVREHRENRELYSYVMGGLK